MNLLEDLVLQLMVTASRLLSGEGCSQPESFHHEVRCRTQLHVCSQLNYVLMTFQMQTPESVLSAALHIHKCTQFSIYVT